jgi:hypothetical protein
MNPLGSLSYRLLLEDDELADDEILQEGNASRQGKRNNLVQAEGVQTNVEGIARNAGSPPPRLPCAFGLDLAIQAEQNRIYCHLGMAFNFSYAWCTLVSG